ncbi:MAG: type II secretion system protein GspG [Leptospiraceae bacterium]|nr:type II secretion system protein GspG [Leptospiraceae bacterium]
MNPGKIRGLRIRSRLRKGLTLVELAIVLLVLGVIIGIVYANIDFGVVDDAKRVMFPAQAKTLESVWQRYEMSGAQIPEGSSLEVLAQKDPNNPSWRPVQPESVKDFWGRPYFICSNPQGYREICTLGADGQPGGEGENADFYVTDQSSWPAWLAGNKQQQQ